MPNERMRRQERPFPCRAEAGPVQTALTTGHTGAALSMPGGSSVELTVLFQAVPCTGLTRN